MSAWILIRTLVASAADAPGPPLAVVGVPLPANMSIVEFRVQNLVTTGDPTSLVLFFWRIQTGTVELIGTQVIQTADNVMPEPKRVISESPDVYVTIGFTGGTNPTASGTIEARGLFGLTDLGIGVVPGLPAAWGLYAEDSASADGELGELVLAVRQDTLASSVTNDGDHAWLKTDAMGALWERSRAYDEPTGADKNEPIYSDADRFVPFTFSAAGVGSGVTTNYYIDMAGFDTLNLDWNTLVGGDNKTLKVYASNRDDGTAPAAIGTWQDVTLAATGAASWVAAAVIRVLAPDWKWIKIEIVTAGGAGGSGWTGYGRKKAISAGDPLGSQPVSGTVSATQGTAAAVAGGWPVKITDGVSTGAVKAASTAPVAADPAQVVSFNPIGNAVTSALGSWLPALAAAPANSAVITAAACKLGRVQAVNSHATISYFLMLFDLAAVPANGTAPRYPSIPLVPGQALMLPYGGATHAAGLCWAASTTAATLTVSATTPFQCSAEIL